MYLLYGLLTDKEFSKWYQVNRNPIYYCNVGGYFKNLFFFFFFCFINIFLRLLKLVKNNAHMLVVFLENCE